MTRRVGLIGYGAIAREVERQLRGDPAVQISHVLLRPARAKQTWMIGGDVQAVTTVHEFPSNLDIVIECAGHGAVREYLPDVLRRGIDAAVVSAGALADDDLSAELQSASDAGCSRLSILPGAIGGMDALSAAGSALQEVTYSSRKPPLSWAGSPAEEGYDLNSITETTLLFSGTAREAALRFPKNANVVATVALAGVGFDQTMVKLWADPAAKGNKHSIKASGGGYDFAYTTKGAALARNPRTSALTAQSVLRYLHGLTPGIHV